MINVSNEFKTAMKQPIKELKAYIKQGEVEIRSEDDLINFKISAEGNLCKTVMRKFEGKYKGNHNLLGTQITPYLGVKLPDNSYEYAGYGSFLITEMTDVKDSEYTTVVAYDKMIMTMIDYKVQYGYPMTLGAYTNLLCQACGLELATTNFANSDWIIPYELYENFVGIKYRDVFTQIAEATGTIIMIGNDDKVYLKTPIATSEQLTYANMFKLKLEPMYGQINSVVLSRQPQEDNVIHNDDVSITFGSTTKNLFKGDQERIFGTSQCTIFDNTFEFYADGSQTGTIYPAHKGYYNVGRLKPNTKYTWYVEVLEKSGNTGYHSGGSSNNGQATSVWTGFNSSLYTDMSVGAKKVFVATTTDLSTANNNSQMYWFWVNFYAGNVGKVKIRYMLVEGEHTLTSISSYVAFKPMGTTEFKISNNEIIDKDRETAIIPIFNNLNGIKYYPFEADTEGLGWYEIGDKITIMNNLGELFETIIFNYSVSVDGSIKEKLYSRALNKTETKYQFAGTINQRIKKTEIEVDKQKNTITSLVSDMYDEDGVVNENYTKIYQDLTNIVNSVQQSGGGNLAINSVMFGYTTNGSTKVPTGWTISGSGTLDIQSSPEALSNGISGNVFTLNDKTAKQRIYVKPDDPSISEALKTYYTFSCKIKKGSVGSCYVKISNANESRTIPLDVGVSSFYGEYELKELLPTTGYYDLEFYGSAGSDATFTDVMFAVGKYKSQWQQANGETMNTQVNISVDGVLVKSSIYLGDYTIMSPLEFAGYSIINGTLTKVFSLNKDTTNVKKLRSTDEITMTPIKIVPQTTGDVTGWAFVPST